MNFRVAVGVLSVLCGVSLVCAHDWTYCPGTGPGHLTVNTVTLTPDPPVKGQNETVSLTGTIDETITGGNIALVILFGSLPLHESNYDICLNSTITCPYTEKNIDAGILIDSSLTGIIPPGVPLIGQATVTDKQNVTWACIQVQFTIPKSFENSEMESSGRY